MPNNKNIKKNNKNIKKNNYNNTLSAIQYILNKREQQRKINKNDLFLHNNENHSKNKRKNNISIPSYRKQKEYGLNKFIKP